ncbi:MAG: hypothetical protein M1821_005463 [Bathelium mastoideum]|nr:MAG: hypothetical protein M1821_005463 [Bathelium mastoideum]KAI9691793.1 MAG: hypothetical protein M1822_007865 [Bathelium mastoideum]
MAGQQIYIEETIRAMKKAIAREDDASDSDDSIVNYTNRGNKLKRKAKYVQEGKLNNPSGPQAYRRAIEHAGYIRDIISRNPARFDEDGDEIEDDEYSESAEINDEDPYSGIVIEDILGPLTSVADLPKHPSLSVPYTSQAIKELADNAAEMVRRENATLCRMKQLFTKLRGDETWAPCGIFETDNDRLLFARSQGGSSASRASPSQRAQPSDSFRRDPAAIDGGNKFALAPVPVHNRNGTTGHGAPNAYRSNGGGGKTNFQGESIAAMDMSNSNLDVRGQKDNAQPQENYDLAPLSSLVNTSSNPDGSSVQIDQADGRSSAIAAISASAHLENGGSAAVPYQNGDQELPDAPTDDGEEEATTSSEPLSHRMTTRAQAKAPLSKDPSSSPTTSPETWIHPIFSVPASAIPDKDFGLPGAEAEETRKLLLLYVQKQEEVVRGVRSLHDGLLRANRMKENVFEWSKAEGHLGEMSDGEDWYDKEKWGLDADLVKGREEEEDETNLPGKKTRQRRQ